MLRTGSDNRVRSSECGVRSGFSSHSALGLTLIEILISVAILSAAVTLILQGLVRGAYVLSVTEHRLKAYVFAMSKLADLETELRQGTQPLSQDGEFREGPLRFEWRVDCAPVLEEPMLELVTLTVSWRQGRQTYAMPVSLIHRLAAPVG